MTDTTRDSMRAAVLAAVDDYGTIPAQFSSFRHLLADAVVAAHDHEERRQPDYASTVAAATQSLMGVWRGGYSSGHTKALSQAVDVLRAAGMHEAAEKVLAL